MELIPIKKKLHAIGDFPYSFYNWGHHIIYIYIPIIYPLYTHSQFSPCYGTMDQGMETIKIYSPQYGCLITSYMLLTNHLMWMKILIHSSIPPTLQPLQGAKASCTCGTIAPWRCHKLLPSCKMICWQYIDCKSLTKWDVYTSTSILGQYYNGYSWVDFNQPEANGSNNGNLAFKWWVLDDNYQ